jgi:hypothetical protein
MKPHAIVHDEALIKGSEGMHYGFAHTIFCSCVGSVLLCTFPIAAYGQQLTALSSMLARSEGVDTSTSTSFSRLYLTAQTDPPPAQFDLASPTLTIQCTRRPGDKYFVELFVNFGGITDTAFYPPWRPADDTDLFPPRTEKVSITLEFLGYTHVKPVRREFEFVTAPIGQLRYNPPSGGSHNLEEIVYYFQYLRALPTFHISYSGHTATFLTEPLLAQIRKEPLCRASHL